GVSIGRGFGSQYLGSIFRTTHAGNTPPLFVETGDPGATRLRRLRMLRKLAATLDRLGVQRPFRAQEPGVGCTVFVSQGRKLFFVTNRSGQDVLKNVRISPGPGWRFAGISGGVLLNPKRCGNVWTSNIATHDTSCMIEFRTTND
ncbi:MAG: hypothetical protein N3B12_04155, partial [Armatimonadetes bacterium]|nr:hypothetical protein [Armatimonadota bacterium]